MKVIIPPGNTSLVVISFSLCECQIWKKEPLVFRFPFPGARSSLTPRNGLPL